MDAWDVGCLGPDYTPAPTPKGWTPWQATAGEAASGAASLLGDGASAVGSDDVAGTMESISDGAQTAADTAQLDAVRALAELGTELEARDNQGRTVREMVRGQACHAVGLSCCHAPSGGGRGRRMIHC